MHIYFDEKGYVYGYGSEPEAGSVIVASVPKEVDEYLECYKYENGEYIPNEERKAYLDTLRASEAEMHQLETWFNWYDQQTVQYHRAIRLGLEFDQDIDELDTQAVRAAERIKELREILLTPLSALN